MRGLAKIKLNDFEHAIVDFDKVVELEPSNVDAFYNRGISNAALSHFATAILDYDQALRMRPDYAEVFDSRANAKEKMKDDTGALSDYDHAIALDPLNKKYYLQRGALELRLHRKKNACADLKKYKELGGTLSDPKLNKISK